MWDTVTAVEFVGELPCYDFEMSDPRRPYALAEDVLVDNCGKKIRALMAKEREKFVAGCVNTGYKAELGTSCSTSSSRSPTTPSPRPTRTATASSPTRPPG